MPLYYFDVRDTRGFHRDEYGDELPSLDEAVAQAQCILPDIVRDELPDGDWHDVSCDVRNDHGYIVYRGELTYRGTRL